jgi:hypothetical protein
MAHALRHNAARQFGRRQGWQPGRWWGFLLAALVAAAIGFALIHSPLFERKQPAPGALPEVIIEVVPGAPLEPPAPAAGTDAAAAPAAAAPAASDEQPASAVGAPAPLLAVPAPVPAFDMRGVDFAALPQLQALARTLGGRIATAEVIFADVTADGRDEAIVPISSDGTFGNLGYAVLKEGAAALETVLTLTAGRERRGPVLTVDRGQLAATSGVYGPLDPNCCPSQIRKTYFRWNGRALVEDRTETITIPKGAKAD